ncbi:hypothetical protein [Hoeflea poritis]|uniref:Uncharacterized protein n=1 Tax=Hoeflea poritis TaxID=2993659 RepID=A0ABT4VWS6_9HYPH|nr:hypothetical protein [Hoeflea poritis]MDA4848497.1 hypothetical protein [Hoeflea poritis]
MRTECGIDQIAGCCLRPLLSANALLFLINLLTLVIVVTFPGIRLWLPGNLGY